jgi:superfamily II DNA or RNA helicase
MSQEVENNFELFAYQQENVDDMNRILNSHYGTINCSAMGLGKTFVSCALARARGMKIFVVAPKTALVSTWEKVVRQYNIECLATFSYTTIRGNKTYKPTHGYLEVDDEGTFRTTKKFRQDFSEPTLLVFDEVHNLKNDSAQYRACRELANQAAKACPLNRVLLLSATPIDGQEKVINLLRLCNFISNDDLSTKEGIESVYNMASRLKKYSPEAVSRIMQKVVLRNIVATCYSLYIEVLKDLITTSMEQQTKVIEADVKNGYFAIEDEKEKHELETAISCLSDVSRYNHALGARDKGKLNWGAITGVLQNIEQCKLGILIREARKSLQNPGVKIVIFVNYLKTIGSLEKELKEFNPVVLEGKITGQNRAAVVDSFQTDDSVRVLIGSTKLGQGIDLDDKVGDKPRHCFIIPTFSVIDLHQAQGRVLRQSTKSVPIVRYVYGNLDDRREVSILDSLSRKSDVLKEVTSKNAENQTKFPGDYGSVVYN